MRIWKKHNKDEVRYRVFRALRQNVDFEKVNPIGIPGSHLDSNVFYSNASFLNDAPFLSTLLHNPNHIGCHTLGKSESFFKGTQDIERELIAICSEDILNAETGACDGYVASGGTEANIQAIWIYRNFFREEYKAQLNEICIITSADYHYSMRKAADLLNIRMVVVDVDDADRSMTALSISQAIENEKQAGTKYFIAVANMMTTMFGSVDDPSLFADSLLASNCPFKLHVDGAYGGFIYPFTNRNNQSDFRNPHVSSVTLDAHKMVQAPYGTGIFIVHKGMMQYVNTKDASYVEGEDYTLIGSRSGANSVAVWMILATYGPYGWFEKISILMKRTDWLASRLDELGIEYFRNPYANIVTIRAKHLTHEMAAKYGLVPDNHKNPLWYKVVVMDHVTIELLVPLVDSIRLVLKTEFPGN